MKDFPAHNNVVASLTYLFFPIPWLQTSIVNCLIGSEQIMMETFDIFILAAKTDTANFY